MCDALCCLCVACFVWCVFYMLDTFTEFASRVFTKARWVSFLQRVCVKFGGSGCRGL